MIIFLMISTTICTFFSTPITNTTALESPLYRSFLKNKTTEESINKKQFIDTITWAETTTKKILNARVNQIPDEEIIDLFINAYEEFYTQNNEIEDLPPVSAVIDFFRSTENKKQLIEDICTILDFIVNYLESPEETTKQIFIFFNILKNAEAMFSKIDPSKADFALEQLSSPFLRAIPDSKASILRKVALLNYYFDANTSQLNSLYTENRCG